MPVMSVASLNASSVLRQAIAKVNGKHGLRAYLARRAAARTNPPEMPHTLSTAMAMGRQEAILQSRCTDETG